MQFFLLIKLPKAKQKRIIFYSMNLLITKQQQKESKESLASAFA